MKGYFVDSVFPLKSNVLIPVKSGKLLTYVHLFQSHFPTRSQEPGARRRCNLRFFIHAFPDMMPAFPDLMHAFPDISPITINTGMYQVKYTVVPPTRPSQSGFGPTRRLLLSVSAYFGVQEPIIGIKI
jgi:hypothetical protein